VAGRRLKRQYLQGGENQIDPIHQFHRIRLGGAESKSRRDNDAGADALFSPL
jgi:hypothetical protein